MNIRIALFFVIIALGFVGCAQFEENLREDRYMKIMDKS